MHVYFIRHGETAFNKAHIHQGPDVPLSSVGKKQIARTGEHLKQFPITKLVTSDFTRTKESAEIIGNALGLAPEPQPLFREVRRPSALYGKRHYSLTTLVTGINIVTHMRNADWRHTDGENLFDVRDRVGESVTYLEEESDDHEHIAVVSHAFIINLFMKYMCASTTIKTHHYLQALFRASILDNASVSKVTYTDDNNPNTCDWNCISFNSHAHLE